ncbi:MAG: hypothetical protein A2147_10140 [Chloroflexi bacterium RBG_16_57_8]|nr:MAG: hypothetical protein A2147_10140 [Chloroflexi bacterium RBG_16_57_8]
MALVVALGDSDLVHCQVHRLAYLDVLEGQVLVLSAGRLVVKTVPLFILECPVSVSFDLLELLRSEVVNPATGTSML